MVNEFHRFVKFWKKVKQNLETKGQNRAWSPKIPFKIRKRKGSISLREKIKDRETPFRYPLFDTSRKGEIQIGRMGVHHVQVDLVQKGCRHCK